MGIMSKYGELLNKLTETPSKGEGPRLLAIDGTNFFFRVFTAVPLINSNGEHIGGLYGFLSSLALNIRNYQPDECVIVFDSKGGSQRRKKIFPQYKANRNKNKTFNRPNEFKDLMDEEEQMKRQFHRLMEYLDLLPIKVIVIPQIEADDTIAYILSHHSEKYSSCRIVSTDKDFLQLINDKIEVYNPVSKYLFNMSNIHEKFGVMNRNILLCRTIDGDSGDNISGVKGVGILSLIKTFPKIVDEELQLDDILNECNIKLQEKKPKQIYKTLIENEDIIKRNFELMQLRDVDIPGNAKLTIMSALDKKLSIIDRFKFRKLWAEDYLQNSIRDPEKWININFAKLELNARKSRLNI